ncbi:uncharacterized protein M6B38_401520 [Iris pallida]|uniref:Uncharacterized protein n=1 Tax=Iris pallida TaxID=29817 RepID=A0AAX6FU69_IRIPA|nr:uncharacterized protein M6B38_401520 [Iris pallida]
MAKVVVNTISRFPLGIHHRAVSTDLGHQFINFCGLRLSLVKKLICFGLAGC